LANAQAAGLGTMGVNQPQTAAEAATFRHCVEHGRPFCSKGWSLKTETMLKPDPRRHRERKKKVVEI
jgi:hypothetical protein